MKKKFFNTAGKQERQRKRYEATRVLKGTGNVERCARRQAEAQREAVRQAIERGWENPNVFQTNGGVYVVGGRDQAGLYHVGGSRESWKAAFRDVDERDKHLKTEK